MKKITVMLLLTLVIVTGGNAQQSASHDPYFIFNEFWLIMKDNYAFFELREMDWDQQKLKYLPKVKPEIENDTLFSVLLEMIRPLNDGHTFIEYNGKVYRSTGEMAIWREAKHTHQLVMDKYLQSHYEIADGHIFYGWITEDLGYIKITAMEGYPPEQIDQALNYLRNAKNLIVDVRFNGGGDDTVSLSLASRFTDQKRPVYSKETFFKGVMKDYLDLFIEPLQGVNIFRGKVFLLTNRATFSAAEMFVMAMVSLPNCISIGENTGGAHSDILQKKLSNGWTIGLSNQVYTMPDGKVYEKIGIAPKIEVVNPIGHKEDRVLEKAIDLSRSSK